MPSSISQFSIFNFQLRKYLNCSFHTRQCLFFAQHPGDVEHMRARLNLGKNYSASLSAGPYIAYGVGGKTSGEMEEYDYSSEYNPNRSYRFRIDTFGNRIDDKMGNKRFDAGLMFGLNIKYHKFIFGAELQLGMIKVNDQLDNLLQSSGIEKFSPKNLASFFTVGYRF